MPGLDRKGIGDSQPIPCRACGSLPVWSRECSDGEDVGKLKPTLRLERQYRSSDISEYLFTGK